MENPSLFQVLPLELGLMVLERLSPQDVCLSFGPTCRHANALVNHPHLWLSLYRKLALAQASEKDDEESLLARLDAQASGQEAEQQRWDRVWLLNEGMTVGEALRRSHPIDWKQEYICRATFRVLVLAHHGAHNSYRYDLSVCRQLAQQGIPFIRICHPDCQGGAPPPSSKLSSSSSASSSPSSQRKNLSSSSSSSDTSPRRFFSLIFGPRTPAASSPECCQDFDNGGFRCVPFTPTAHKGFSAILVLNATAPSEQNKVAIGNMLYDHLQSGGGIVMCCYTYLLENCLSGKWAPHFYPMPSSGFSSPLRSSNTVLGQYDKEHPIMNGVRRVAIDGARDTARCKSEPFPRAQVVAHYADGPPLVVVYDGKANRDNSKQRDPYAQAKENDEDGGDEEDDDDEGWGKTVFVNVFPVSTEDSKLGGWYPPAPHSDIPRLLANAVLYAARKQGSPPKQ